MVSYSRREAREWARANMHGLCNVVVPSYTQDLRRLSEKGIRHDVAATEATGTFCRGP